MLLIVVLFTCLALCQSHILAPLVVPAVHSIHVPLAHYGLHGYYGHSLGHGFVAKPIGHHIWKRSPHYLAPLGHLAPVHHVEPVAHVAPLAHVVPVAVSHHSRYDVHTSPAVVPAPIVKSVAALLPTPILHKGLIAAPWHYGIGHYSAGHYGHYAPHLSYY